MENGPHVITSFYYPEMKHSRNEATQRFALPSTVLCFSFVCFSHLAAWAAISFPLVSVANTAQPHLSRSLISYTPIDHKLCLRAYRGQREEFNHPRLWT